MRTSLLVGIAVAVLLALMGSLFVVREGETAMVFNLGRVVRTDIKPGLRFKVPLLETARVFDTKLQVLEMTPARYFTSEQKDVQVDFIAIGYIADVGAFYRATGGVDSVATDRLSPIITSSLRNEINARTLRQLVSGDRNELIAKQLGAINEDAKALGMRIVDIRLKQVDLPTDNDVLQNVYERMSAQRRQEASRLRAEGEEQARTIRAQADRDQTVLVAEAERDAQKMRGEGDAAAARIYAEAANRDPSFYAFQRSLEAYRASFKGGNSVIVLDKDDPFLQYLRSDR